MKFELRLVDIKLKDFRLFEKIKVNFDDKLTVLIGENGAGKTALLEGIAKALNVFTENMKSASTSNFNFNAIYKDTDIRFGTKESQTSITIEFLEIEKLLPEKDSKDFFLLALKKAESEVEKQNILQQIDNVIEKLNKDFSSIEDENEDEKQVIDIEIAELLKIKNNNNIEIENANSQKEVKRGKQRGNGQTEELYEDAQIIDDEWVTINWEMIQTKKNADIHKFSDLSKLNKLAKQVHTASRREENLSLPVVAYYSSDRISTYFDTNAVEAEDTEVFNAYGDALNGKALNFKWFLDWFIWKEDNIKTQATVLNAVKEAIKQVFNDDETLFKEIKTDRTRKKDYRLMFEKGNSIVQANQLSSGEKSLLILVADLARWLALATPFSNDPLKEGQGIVLIDEIDLHLHPRWQRKVIGKLQEIFPKIQWVITTHSPQVLGEVENGKIYMLDNQEVRLLNFNTYGKDMNRLLDRIMGVPERNATILAAFDDYFESIERNQLEKAATIRQYLESKIGTDEPLFKRADGIIKRKQLIGR